MFGILGWIIFGVIVGLLARLLHPGRDPAGFVITALLGIAGSLLGGSLAAHWECTERVKVRA